MLKREETELITPVGPGTNKGGGGYTGIASLPIGADWVEATRELRKAYIEHPELDPTLNGPL